MWRAVCIGLALVGCYAPTVPQGAPCAVGQPCPRELVCQGGACVAPGAAGADARGADGAVEDARSPDARSIDAPPAADAPIDAFACPATYLAITGQTSRYRTVTQAKTWTQAEADCEADGVGNHLAVIDDATEENAVDALTGASIWFGLSDLKTEGSALWVTGAAPSYTATVGSKNSSVYDCAGIYRHQWAWGDCATLIPYVCECDGIPAQPTAY